MAKKDRWFVPTNTENLKMMIAQGLIGSPDGFAKYYSDVLAFAPKGYIPFFKNRIQPDALQCATSEAENLIPCILEIDLSKFEGKAKIFSNNILDDISLNEIENTNGEILFVLAPIPLASISKIIFRTANEKKSFEKDAKLYSNVPLNDLVLYYTKRDQKLFSSKAEIMDIPLKNFKEVQIETFPSLNYRRVYAYGGLLVNLFYFSKNGLKSHETFLYAIEQTKKLSGDETIVLNYLLKKPSVEKENINQILYKGLVDVAVENYDFKEGIIDFLNSIEKAQNIAKKLLEFERRSDKPISKEFKEARTRYGKVLLMMFVREDSDALINYELDIFDESDYLIFAMLFGIRDKFSKTPKFIREFDGVQNFITTKMANYAHHMMESSMRFKEPKNPPTIMTMLKNDRFKEYMAKDLKMEQCFQTIISASTYQVIKGKPVMEGIVMPKFEILEERYFNFISKYKLTQYNKFLKKYEKLK